MSKYDSFKDLLIGLCSNDEDNQILDKLCTKVVNFTQDTVEFEDAEFGYQKDKSLEPSSELPCSFAEIATLVSKLSWDGGGPEVGFELWGDGSSAADGWLFDEVVDEEKVEQIKGAGQGDPGDAFVAGQNALFFDPTRKLNNGEPALAFVDHGCCEWVDVESVNALNYKQILLRLISDSMIDTNYIPEVSF